MKRYDSTNPNYIDEIVKITKFDPERAIKSLNDKEFEMFWKAIEFVEKWKVGTEDFIEKWIIWCHCGISSSQISERCVDYKGPSYSFSIEGRLHAVIPSEKWN